MSLLVRSPGPVSDVPARAANGRRYSLQVEQLSEFKTRTSRKASVSSSESKSFEVSQKGRMGKKDKRRLEVRLVPSYRHTTHTNTTTRNTNTISAALYCGCSAGRPCDAASAGHPRTAFAPPWVYGVTCPMGLDGSRWVAARNAWLPFISLPLPHPAPIPNPIVSSPLHPTALYLWLSQ